MATVNVNNESQGCGQFYWMVVRLYILSGKNHQQHLMRYYFDIHMTTYQIFSWRNECIPFINYIISHSNVRRVNYKTCILKLSNDTFGFVAMLCVVPLPLANIVLLHLKQFLLKFYFSTRNLLAKLRNF